MRKNEMKIAGGVVLAVLIAGIAACGLFEYDETLEYILLAEVTSLSVPDSSLHSNVRVRVAGILGSTTAYSFEQVVWERTESLVEIAVFARQVERSRTSYEYRDILFDTTLVFVFMPADTGLRYFRARGSAGSAEDSTVVY